MEEHFVGYLLDALDPNTHREVAEFLEANSDARVELDRVRRALAPLALNAEPVAPPAGLADRTLAFVHAKANPRLPNAPIVPPTHAGPRFRPWYRRVDLLVAAVLLILVGGVALPWMLEQRSKAQVLACQENLHQHWLALRSHSDRHEGAFPHVQAGTGPRSMAGVFVPVLNESGSMPQGLSVGCPAQGRESPKPITVRELDRLYREAPNEFHRVAHELAGDYAYTLGYRDGDRLVGLHRDSGGHYPILADRPPRAGGGNSLNHSGTGQNVLYVGGEVRWHPERKVTGDDIFLNRQFQIGAGLDRHDTVLGASGATPGKE